MHSSGTKVHRKETLLCELKTFVHAYNETLNSVWSIKIYGHEFCSLFTKQISTPSVKGRKALGFAAFSTH